MSAHLSSSLADAAAGGDLPASLAPYRYEWPRGGISGAGEWSAAGEHALQRFLPEAAEDIARDSRWPAFFPCAISIVTTRAGAHVHVEKVVGASIVNRFPYVVALSFCRRPLSERHYARRHFMDVLERGGVAAIQFLPPGPDLDAVLAAIADVPDAAGDRRVAATGQTTRPGHTNGAPVCTSAYLVYEARLAQPGRDFEGSEIYKSPWADVGSHRVYFLEIAAIQLRRDIAEGRSQIRWRSVPRWTPDTPLNGDAPVRPAITGYQKPYNADYRFPSATTIGFEYDELHGDMAVRYLPPLPADQVEVDNDRARWPCFFPSSVGMITTWAAPGIPDVMPCGSTTIVSRHPLVVTPCISYARINERYAPRVTLDVIRRTGRFGCSVPFLNERVLSALKYTGNVSFARDADKVASSGLTIEPHGWAPVIRELPVHFDCEVTGEMRLGTHAMFLGEVRRLQVRSDVHAGNPLEWCPWADVLPVNGAVGGQR